MNDPMIYKGYSAQITYDADDEIFNLNRCPTHPGELLREDLLPEVKRSKAEISQLLGISR
jgi:predicted HicB family RNase H-like nuclease